MATLVHVSSATSKSSFNFFPSLIIMPCWDLNLRYSTNHVRNRVCERSAEDVIPSLVKIVGYMRLSKSFYIPRFLHTLERRVSEWIKGHLRDQKRKKGEVFELRSSPLRLDCPFRLTTPMAGSCDSSTKTQTEYLCSAVRLCLVPWPDTRTSRFLFSLRF